VSDTSPAFRVCLLTTQDLDAVPFPDDDWPCDPRSFLPEAEWHVAVLEGGTSARAVRELIAEGFDLFFNLCDGAADEDTPGIEVVRTLERADVPFTGATSVFYEPSRAKMKRVCRSLGIHTPAGVTARTEADIDRAAATLRFPLFVKHPSSYASIDISRHSKTTTPAGLRRQARKMIGRHGAALIEEYIDGIECTVLVAEHPDGRRKPTTYTPIEYRFPPGESFKHSDLKWEDFAGMSAFPVRSPDLERKLRDDTARFFVGIEGASFGRCDFRVDASGHPFLLEINPNCGLYYTPDAAGGADLCLLHDPAGHEGFTRQIVAAALARHRRGRRTSRQG
jgi:D-alanine-D-alanine ligase